MADALDLGSSDFIVGVQVPSSAPHFRTCRIYFCKFFTLTDKPTDKSYFACRLVFFGRDSRLPKQFTELFCLRLVFIRTTDKKLTGFDCKLFSCLLFVRLILPRNCLHISYRFRLYSSFQGMVLSLAFQGGVRIHLRE